jgi:hypothetical protein
MKTSVRIFGAPTEIIILYVLCRNQTQYHYANLVCSPTIQKFVAVFSLQFV